MIAGHVAGATVYELATELGVHRHTISKHLHARGFQTVNRVSDEETRAAIHLYAEGWSLARIGDHLGRDHTVIRNVLERSGVQRRDTHGRTVASP